MQAQETSEVRQEERADLVREHLLQIARSDSFKGSKRAQEFLQLIVEHALAGRLGSLRERDLGAEMFGRPISYDTANDAVVRVKASEVRKKLAQYYGSLDVSPFVRIDLPSGSYVPEFYFEPPPVPPPPTIADPGLSNAELLQPAQPVQRVHDRLRHILTSRLSWIPILAFCLLLASGGYWAFEQSWWRHPTPATSIRSIAVLPLVNRSGDPAQDYFADGMTEELTTELGQIASLHVISRTSSMTYKRTKKTLPEIARELQVDAVLEGSVIKEGNKARIRVQLIDAATGKDLWTQSYDRDMPSILEIQSEVAIAIADRIQLELTPQQQARLNSVPHVDPQAVEMYLHGVQKLDAGDPAGAIAFFYQAIDKDSTYAAPHGALATAYGWMGNADKLPYAEAFAKQKAEALKAIALDNSLAEGHLALGTAAMEQDWDWETAKREIQRALELDPNSSSVRVAYARYLNRVGSVNEAVSQAELAVRLDPASVRPHISAVFFVYLARQYDQALAQMQQVEAMHPDPSFTPYPLALIYVEKGWYDRAILQFQKLNGVPYALGHMGNAYAREGHADQARAILPMLKEDVTKTGVGRYEIALVYSGLNEKDNAFEWLEKAYQAHDKSLTYLKIDPCLDPLRSDPRLKDLEKRVGLPL
jgi:TolB-like protein/Tfp pilus assembly protein PilF